MKNINDGTSMRGLIVKRAIEDHPLLAMEENGIHRQFTKSSLARHLFHQNPGVFETIDGVRKLIRYYMGADGDENRKCRGIKEGKLGTPFDRPHISIAQPPSPFFLAPGKWLILSDIHAPYHSDIAIYSALEYGEKHGCNKLLLNGDFIDAYGLSYFNKNPRAMPFSEECLIAIGWLTFFKKKFKIVVYKFGNHERRCEDYANSHAPEMVGLPTASLSECLTLDDLKIEWVADRRIIKAGKCHIIHGHEAGKSTKNLMNQARWLYNKTKNSTMCSHLHKTDEYNTSTIDEELHSNWVTGCLCALHPEYAVINEWNWGFSTIEIESDGAYFVDNRRILSRGKEIGKVV